MLTFTATMAPTARPVTRCAWHSVRLPARWTPSIVQGQVKLEAYPNPATTTLSINTTGFTGRGQLRIIDMSGRPVVQQAMPASKASVGVQALARGVYYLQLVSAEGNIVGQTRFVKQ
jgi:hypothetical protein